MLLHLVTRPSDPEASPISSTPDEPLATTTPAAGETRESVALVALRGMTVNGETTDDARKRRTAVPFKGGTDCIQPAGRDCSARNDLANGFVCPHHDCGKVFSSLDQLYRHLRRTAQRECAFRSAGEAISSCSWCVFDSICFGPCPILHEVFLQPSGSDAGQRDYACAVCGASFPVFSALVAHRRSVHSSKLHACEHCGKVRTAWRTETSSGCR